MKQDNSKQCSGVCIKRSLRILSDFKGWSEELVRWRKTQDNFSMCSYGVTSLAVVSGVWKRQYICKLKGGFHGNHSLRNATEKYQLHKPYRHLILQCCITEAVCIVQKTFSRHCVLKLRATMHQWQLIEDNCSCLRMYSISSIDNAVCVYKSFILRNKDFLNP